METQEGLNIHAQGVREGYGPDNIFAVMLYGSQNYGLSTPESDVDTKVIYLPPFRQFCLNEKLISEERIQADGGIANVKDIRLMFGNFLKCNINFLECLYTDYYWVNPMYQPLWNELREMRDIIARHDPKRLLHAAAGMARQKYVAMEKPFESKMSLIEKYGYDPKQLHHLCRLHIFIRDYLKTVDFGACLKPSPEDTEYLLRLKTHPFHLGHARQLKEQQMKEIDTLVEDLDRPSLSEWSAKEQLDDLCVRILQTHFRYELTHSIIERKCSRFGYY